MAKILVIEDEEPILNAYYLVLTNKGHQVTAAHNASEGLAAIAKESFDLILLDLLMPEVSGIDFLKQVQPKTKLPQTRVVVLTNTESPKIINEAMELGATRYLLKVENTPYDIADQVEALLKP